MQQIALVDAVDLLISAWNGPSCKREGSKRRSGFKPQETKYQEATTGLDKIKRDKKKVRDLGWSQLYVSQLEGITGLAQQ